MPFPSLKLIVQYLLANTQEILKSITANKLMNINSENIGELAGNQSILDKKKENTSKVSFLKENIKGGISYFLI